MAGRLALAGLVLLEVLENLDSLELLVSLELLASLVSLVALVVRGFFSVLFSLVGLLLSFFCIIVVCFLFLPFL